MLEIVGAITISVIFIIISFFLSYILYILLVSGFMTLLQIIAARRRGMKRKDHYASTYRVFRSCINIYEPYTKEGIIYLWDDIKIYWNKIKYPIPFISREDDEKRYNSGYTIVKDSKNV